MVLPPSSAHHIQSDPRASGGCAGESPVMLLRSFPSMTQCPDRQQELLPQGLRLQTEPSSLRRATARVQGSAQCQEHMGDKGELSKVIRGKAKLPEERTVGKMGSKRREREGIKPSEADRGAWKWLTRACVLWVSCQAEPPLSGKMGRETLLLQGCFRSQGNMGKALTTSDRGPWC